MCDTKMERKIKHTNNDNLFIFYSNLKYFLALEKYNWIENNRKYLCRKIKIL